MMDVIVTGMIGSIYILAFNIVMPYRSMTAPLSFRVVYYTGDDALAVDRKIPSCMMRAIFMVKAAHYICENDYEIAEFRF